MNQQAIISEAMKLLGRKGGASTSEAKRKASAANLARAREKKSLRTKSEPDKSRETQTEE